MNEIKQIFKIGDVVQLKSGGPEMTVSNLKMNLNMSTQNYDKFTGLISCKWFSDNGKSMEEEFHQDTLEKDDE